MVSVIRAGLLRIDKRCSIGTHGQLCEQTVDNVWTTKHLSDRHPGDVTVRVKAKFNYAS